MPCFGTDKPDGFMPDGMVAAPGNVFDVDSVAQAGEHPRVTGPLPGRAFLNRVPDYFFGTGQRKRFFTFRPAVV
jgi:hypothetical protein